MLQVKQNPPHLTATSIETAMQMGFERTAFDLVDFFFFLDSLKGFMRKYIRRIIVEDTKLPSSILI